MFSSYLYLWPHATVCVQGNTAATPECCKSEMDTFSLPLTEVIAMLFYTSQIINISKDSESLYLENKQFSLRNMSTAPQEKNLVWIILKSEGLKVGCCMQ